jgi:hypothetical protein
MHEQRGFGFSGEIVTGNRAAEARRDSIVPDADRDRHRQQRIAQQCDDGKPSQARPISTAGSRNARGVVERRISHRVSQPGLC